MQVYIVTKSSCCMVGIESLKIIQVLPAQEAAFHRKYAGCILAAGSSVQEVLSKLCLSLT
jgi:hypothetical protein